jgi:hypothetical protein
MNNANILSSLKSNPITLKRLDPSFLRDRSAANTTLASPDNVDEEEERWK